MNSMLGAQQQMDGAWELWELGSGAGKLEISPIYIQIWVTCNSGPKRKIVRGNLPSLNFLVYLLETHPVTVHV